MQGKWHLLPLGLVLSKKSLYIVLNENLDQIWVCETNVAVRRSV